MGMHNFRELKIWQRSMELGEKVYKIASAFPGEEKYGLVQQIKKCVVSIPSNISEGAGRSSNKQFRYFLEISMGSSNEMMTQMDLSRRLGFVETKVSERIIYEILQVYKMILAFYNSLNTIKLNLSTKYFKSKY